MGGATAPGRWYERLSLSRRVALLVVLAGVILLSSVVVSAFAVINLNNSVRNQVDRLDPAEVAAISLSNALVNEETGTRGYILTGDTRFLAPYELGVAEATNSLSRLRRLLAYDRGLSADVARVAAAASAWRLQFAAPTLRLVASGSPAARSSGTTARGTQLFDAFRGAMGRLELDLSRAHAGADARLTTADHELIALLGLCLLALLAVFEVTWLLIRRWIASPIVELAGEVRQVSSGDFSHAVSAGGSPEVRSLARDVDAMRARIVSDLSEVAAAHRALADQQGALERSNRDLESFAYVASHALQEPLRKMASFSELVVRRYGAQLDDRGREFLGFIADGARRMQRLINDVLEVSRVGRSGRPLEAVDLNDAFQMARANLAATVEATGAVVSTEGLPTVRGDLALLASLFQNLVGNSLKFRSAEPPRVAVSAELGDDGEWQIAVEDNGIGIDPEFSERIFVLFQRLHARSEYPGTGIGLALCQRIVEHHGGRIWLDTAHRPGTRIVFTLPPVPAAPAEAVPTDDPVGQPVG